MRTPINHSILCDAADAVVKAVHDNPELAAKGDRLGITGFTHEQIRQGTEFAVRLGLVKYLDRDSTHQEPNTQG